MKRYSLVFSALLSFFFFYFLFSSQITLAQINLENWQTYSSMLDLRTVSVDSKGRIWCGASGGVFVYDTANHTFKDFKNIDALLSLDVMTVRCNKKTKEIYIGSFDGMLDIVTEDFHWSHLTQIQQPKFPKSQINDIIFDDSSAYIAGGFGLTVLNLKEKVFKATPRFLGNFEPSTMVNSLVIYNGEIWAATESGIAKARLGNNIQNPDLWVNYTTGNGLPGNKVINLAVVNNTLYAAIIRPDTGFICRFEGDSFKVVKGLYLWEPVNNMSGINNNLVYGTPYAISSFPDGKQFYNWTQANDTVTINNFVPIDEKDTSAVVLLKSDGFGIIRGNSFEHIVPNTPNSSLFTRLAVDDSGALWSTHFPDIKGFTKFSDGIWTNFTTKKYPQMLFDDYRQISASTNGRMVMSSWGGGFLLLTHKNGEYQFQIFDSSNSPLRGFDAQNQNYVCTQQSATDANGTIWIISWSKASFPAPLLVGLDSLGKWHTSLNYINSTYRYFASLVIDNSGTKWIGTDLADDQAKGLYYVNDNRTENSSDDIYGIITTNSSTKLPNNAQTCLALDHNGWLWIGTLAGFTALMNPSSVLRNSGLFFVDPKLPNEFINDIMVDALNYIWFATNEGVFVYDNQFNPILTVSTSNSPLISNEVLSLASDPKTGKIYFGTKSGLSVASSLAIEPLLNYDIHCYPQPYSPTTDGNMIIDGLAELSDIRILTINGGLVKAITTTSRKALWDGRDESGNYVSSGIYMVLGTSATNNATEVAKFAVIRK